MGELWREQKVFLWIRLEGPSATLCFKASTVESARLRLLSSPITQPVLNDYLPTGIFSIGVFTVCSCMLATYTLPLDWSNTGPVSNKAVH